MEELRLQLQEANETIDAIRTGQVDALVVKSGDEHQLYTLKSADQTYRVFIEKMKEGAVTLSNDEVILYSNSQFASMVGLPLTEVIGLSFSNFIHEGSKETFGDLMRQGWKSDSKGEIFLKNKNGEMVPFLLSFTSLELDEGRALSVILTDLAVQKEAEKQLKQKNKQLEEAQLAVTKINEHLEELVTERTHELFLSREYFKFLADNIPVIVWTTRADGSADYFNKQWYEYTGLNFDQSKEAGSQQALHPDDFNATVQAWNEAVQNKTNFYFEYRIKRAADGQFRWHLANGTPLKDEAGNVITWFGTSTDIEDQRKELDKKDEFISVASHELRTPLTSLKGYIQLMGAQKDLPEPVYQYIHKASSSMVKLQNLINDLLDMSKIQAGKLKFATEVINLSDHLNAWIENSKHIYSSFSIKKEIAADLFVQGNADRLEQVVMNLVNNAVKYSPDKNEIIVRAVKDEDNVTVSVTDFGIGLSEADKRRIFERFFRVDSESSLTSGLGIGLYISSEVIREHKGTIGVESELNKGAIFSFSLPLTKTTQ